MKIAVAVLAQHSLTVHSAVRDEVLSKAHYEADLVIVVHGLRKKLTTKDGTP